MTYCIIAGSRTFLDYDRLREQCDVILWGRQDIVVLSGKAPGADSLGEDYANERGYRIWHFPANWDAYGKGAGPIRNHTMALRADMLIAFWDGQSPGTKNMIAEAKARQLEVHVIDV